MPGLWLYGISERSGFTFDVLGRPPLRPTVANFRSLITSGELANDREWHIVNHFRSVQPDDVILLYKGDDDIGIIGYATVVAVDRVSKSLELKFDREKCLALVDLPIPATTVRGWDLTLRPNLVDLGPVADELQPLYPWASNPEADELQRRALETTGDGAFSPAGLEDARQRALALIVQRQGQSRFRNRLLSAYGGRCAVTDCDVGQALEAAHIFPYLGPETDHTANGLLLRADVHTLFDLRLLAVDPVSRRVVLSKTLANSDYKVLQNVAIRKPKARSDRPSKEALERAWEEFQSREADR